MQETWVQPLGWECSLEEGMATHSSILAWKVLWTEKPCRLQSIVSWRVRHNWSDLACTHTHTHTHTSNSNMELRIYLGNKVIPFCTFLYLLKMPVSFSPWRQNLVLAANVTCSCMLSTGTALHPSPQPHRRVECCIECSAHLVGFWNHASVWTKTFSVLVVKYDFESNVYFI